MTKDSLLDAGFNNGDKVGALVKAINVVMVKKIISNYLLNIKTHTTLKRSCTLSN